ncbi:MAG: hypothetical protein ABI556_10295 [Gemmatimonadales bacterium]
MVFITVQYRNPDDTQSFLQSLALVVDASLCEVVVVDNAPVEEGRHSIGGNYPFRVHVIEPGKNLYYWGGAAFAIDTIMKATGRLPGWVIVCNNDVTLDGRDFVKRLSTIDGTEFPVIAPSIVSVASGGDQNPILRATPEFGKRFKWRIYDLAYPVAKLMLSIHRAFATNKRVVSKADTKPAKIYAPHGACVIFSSSFFERGGHLDTQVAMFAEELSLAETARGLGLPIWYRPEFRLMHAEHSTTGNRLTREKYRMEQMARRRWYDLLSRN